MIAGAAVHFVYRLLEYRNSNIEADTGDTWRKGFVRRVFFCRKQEL